MPNSKARVGRHVIAMTGDVRHEQHNCTAILVIGNAVATNRLLSTCALSVCARSLCSTQYSPIGLLSVDSVQSLC